MAVLTVKGFVTGKLFADPKAAYGRLAVGIAATTTLLVVLVKVGLPVPVAAGIAAFLGGTLQPRLYRTLKYR